MTRLVLSSGLCGLTILLALATAVLQSKNRDSGLALDSLKEECDMLEAANGEGCELILARDHGPLPVESFGAQGPKSLAKGPNPTTMTTRTALALETKSRGARRLAAGALAHGVVAQGVVNR